MRVVWKINKMYKIEYYFDVDDKFFHIDLIYKNVGVYVMHLYAKNEDALNINIEELKKHYNIVEIENQGQM